MAVQSLSETTDALFQAAELLRAAATEGDTTAYAIAWEQMRRTLSDHEATLINVIDGNVARQILGMIQRQNTARDQAANELTVMSLDIHQALDALRNDIAHLTAVVTEDDRTGRKLAVIVDELHRNIIGLRGEVEKLRGEVEELRQRVDEMIGGADS